MRCIKKNPTEKYCLIRINKLKMKLTQVKKSFSDKIDKIVKIIDKKSIYYVAILYEDFNMNKKKESCSILMLNNKYEIIKFFQSEAENSYDNFFDIKMVLSLALECNTKYLIVIHNDLQKNVDLRQLNLRLEKVCDFIDIILLYHLYIVNNCYYNANEFCN